MALKETLAADIKTAMLARDTLTLQTLQGVKTAIQYEEVAKNAPDGGLDDAAIEVLIARESKKRDEAAELYEKGGNQEAADKERAEKEILKKYLPKQVDTAELEEFISEAINQAGATDVSGMGRVIGIVKAKYGNAVDGALAAKMVRDALSSL